MAVQYFSDRRCALLSLIDYVEAQLNASWTNPTVPVVKAFVKAYEVPVPVVAVTLLEVDSFRSAIGGNYIRQKYIFSIDIFAKSDGQREDLADFMVNIIKNGCVFYNMSHSSSSKEVLDKVADGRLVLLTFDSDRKVDIGSNPDSHDKFRHTIIFTME